MHKKPVNPTWNSPRAFQGTFDPSRLIYNLYDSSHQGAVWMLSNSVSGTGNAPMMHRSSSNQSLCHLTLTNVPQVGVPHTGLVPVTEHTGVNSTVIQWQICQGEAAWLRHEFHLLFPSLWNRERDPVLLQDDDSVVECPDEVLQGKVWSSAVDCRFICWRI